VKILLPRLVLFLPRGRMISRFMTEGFRCGRRFKLLFLAIQGFAHTSVKLLEEFNDCSLRALTEFDLQ
jgi:hypothetical protein